MLNLVVALYAGGDGDPGGGRPGLAAVAVTLAIVAQMVLLVPFTVASGLLAPAWVIAALYGVWIVAALGLIPVARRVPLAAPLVPALNALVLAATLGAGSVWLGWTP